MACQFMDVNIPVTLTIGDVMLQLQDNCLIWQFFFANRLQNLCGCQCEEFEALKTEHGLKDFSDELKPNIHEQISIHHVPYDAAVKDDCCHVHGSNLPRWNRSLRFW